jgi:hypothetical protein
MTIMWLAVITLVVAVAAIAIWLVSRAPSAPPPAPTAIATVVRFTGAMGGVTGCRQQPQFSQKLGFSRSAVLSTAERTMKGLILFEQAEGSQPKIYQHPSWTMAGYLGPNTLDTDGNIYLAPSPRVNLIDNPPEQQNKIYKVDADTGVMAEFIALPFERAPSLNNPYGVLGLTYDCDTHSLYASSVAGSSRREEAGRIYRIDLNTGKVASQLEDVDAIGLGVFNGAQGKRLYFGSARTQDVRSIELDAQGNFAGAPRTEFSLQGLGPDGNEKARKIGFERATDMVVNGAKFNFNLAPPPAQQRPMMYRYRYDPGADVWTFVEAASGALAVPQ